MKLGQALRQFTKWFHVLGQSCYPSFDAFSPATNVNQYARTANFIPSITMLGFMVSFAFASCALIYLLSNAAFSDYIVVALCISSMSFAVFIAVSQSISRRMQFVKLFQQINMFELLTRNRFSINFLSFRRFYLRRMLTILAVCLSALCGTFLRRPVDPMEFATVYTVALLRFVTLITTFHILFYISLFQYIVRAFVRYVEIHATASSPTATTSNALPIQWQGLYARNMIIDLNYFKLIHFVLWEISDSLNKVFGWTIAATLLQVSVYCIYNVYFAFELLYAPKTENESIRKSESIYFHCKLE